PPLGRGQARRRPGFKEQHARLFTMPSTARSVFRAAGLEPAGVVAWGVRPPSDRRGIYVVAMARDPDTVEPTLTRCPIDMPSIEELLDVRPELLLDGKRPEASTLAERVAAFWLPDEAILYIGLAGSSLRQRVGAYYQAPLGARSPHAGGYFLKLLANLHDLSVHYAECD